MQRRAPVRLVEGGSDARLGAYGEVAELRAAMAELVATADRTVPALSGRTVWMVSSTSHGGGVAEMLPTVIALLNELGIATRWALIETEDREFFVLTKRIHNLIHGSGDRALGPAERQLFERVGRDNAAALAPLIQPGDVLVVHDPQPLALLPALGKLGMRTVWRCHIGLDEDLPETRAAWDFLRPYAESCERAVFSAPEYVPAWLRDRSTIIHPALDPLAPKNRDLWLHRLVRVMVNGALVDERVGPVLTPRWQHVVQRLTPSGEYAAAVAGGDIGLLTRPIITQISRWDRLKGFGPLLEAFARLKHRLAEGELAVDDAIQRRRLELARLVLAGPDPASIQDDPEGQEVLDALRGAWLRLPSSIQQDVAVLTLPMVSREQNALLVNALQRSSSLIVQNSLREGFGLTVAEAMWKGIPVLSNRRALGPRHQLRDGVDGRLAADPEDVDELAVLIAEMLTAQEKREQWGRSGQRRAHDEFLVFSQVGHWLDLLADLVASAPRSES